MQAVFRTILIILLALASKAYAFDWSQSSRLNVYPAPREIFARPVTDPETGAKKKLSEFTGKFTLAVFWSRDCPPCLKELASLDGFAEKARFDGIEVIIISKDSEWKDYYEQMEFLKRYGAPNLPFYTDKDGATMGDLGIFSYPKTMMIDARGCEFASIRGSLDWNDAAVVEYIYKLKALGNKE